MTDTVSARQSELELERERVAVRYARLDALRAEKEEQLRRVRRDGLQGSVQNHSERDAFATLYEDRLAQLTAVDERLVFGRLDLDPDAEGHVEERYIGRIGLTDEHQDRLLVDWRAQEAGAFLPGDGGAPPGRGPASSPAAARPRGARLRGRRPRSAAARGRPRQPAGAGGAAGGRDGHPHRADGGHQIGRAHV